MKIAIFLLALLGLACAAPVRERRSDVQAVAELERALSSLLADEQAKHNPPPNRVDGGTGGPGAPGTGGLERLLFSLLAANQDGDTGDPSTTGPGGELADAEGWKKTFSKVKNGIKKGAKLIHKGAELYDKYGHLIPAMQEEEEDENYNLLLALLQDDSFPADYEAPLNSMELADAEGWKKTLSKLKNGIKKGAKLIHKGAELYDKYGHLIPAMQEEEEDENYNLLLALLQDDSFPADYEAPLNSMELADAEGWKKTLSKLKNGIKKGATLIHKGAELYDKYGHLIPAMQEEEEDENYNLLLALLQDDSFPADYEAPLNSMELADAEGWKKTLSKLKNGIKKGAKLIHKGAELYDKYGHLIPAMQEEEEDENYNLLLALLQDDSFPANYEAPLNSMEIADAEGWKKTLSKLKNRIRAKLIPEGAILYDKYGHLITAMQEEEEDENYNLLLALLQDESLPGDYEAPLNSMELADAEGWKKTLSKLKNGIKKGATLIHKGAELYDKYGHLIPAMQEEEEDENDNLLLALLQDESLPGDYEAPLNSMELADAEGWKKTLWKLKNGIKKGAKLIHKGAELYDKYGHLVPAMQEEELLTYLLASK